MNELMRRRRAMMAGSQHDGKWQNDVLTLTAQDFLVGGIQNGYPYIKSGVSRTSYIGMDVTVSTAYTYTITSNSTTRFAVRELYAQNISQVSDSETLNPSPYDSGWKTNSENYTVHGESVLWFTRESATIPDNLTIVITRQLIA